jgi:hypothetical protein
MINRMVVGNESGQIEGRVAVQLKRVAVAELHPIIG